MDLSGETKIFLQLQPDTSGIEYLKTLQDQLTKSRDVILVPNDQLHLTIIHVGALHRLISSLRHTVNVSDEDVFNNAKVLIADFEAIIRELNSGSLHLQSSTFERFGATNKTAVISFDSSPLLEQLHISGLNALQRFVILCGIREPIPFMQADSNLKNALHLRPHITIAKNYLGDNLQVPINTVTLVPTKIVY